MLILDCKSWTQWQIRQNGLLFFFVCSILKRVISKLHIIYCCRFYSPLFQVFLCLPCCICWPGVTVLFHTWLSSQISQYAFKRDVLALTRQNICERLFWQVKWWWRLPWHGNLCQGYWSKSYWWNKMLTLSWNIKIVTLSEKCKDTIQMWTSLEPLNTV